MRLMIDIDNDRVSILADRCMGRFPLLGIEPVITNKPEIIAADVQRYLREKDTAQEKMEQQAQIQAQATAMIKDAAPVESKITVTVEK